MVFYEHDALKYDLIRYPKLILLELPSPLRLRLLSYPSFILCSPSSLFVLMFCIYWEKLAELDSSWKMGPKYVENALSAAPKPSPQPLLKKSSTTTASIKSRRSYSVSTPPSPTAKSVAPIKKWTLVCEETQEITTTAATYSIPPATLFALASFLFTVGLDHEARQVAEISLSEFRQTQDTTGIARALYLLGVILRDLGYVA